MSKKLERTYPYIISVIITCIYLLFVDLNIFYNINFVFLFISSYLLFLLLGTFLWLIQLKPSTNVYKKILIYGGYLIKSYFIELAISYVILKCIFAIVTISSILKLNNIVILYIFVFVITLYIFCMIRCYCICYYLYKAKKIKDDMIIPPESEAEKIFKSKFYENEQI